MSPRTRRSARLSVKEKDEEKAPQPSSFDPKEAEEQLSQSDHVLSDEDDEDDTEETYEFNGQVFATYQDMCHAKRQRNQQVLQDSGLLSLSSQIHQQQQRQASTKKRGLTTSTTNKNKSKQPPAPRRKSRRLNGQDAPHMYVEDERGGKFSFAGTTSNIVGDDANGTSTSADNTFPSFYGDRINDGSDLTLPQAVQAIGDKWLQDDSVPQAQRFCQHVLATAIKAYEQDEDQKQQSQESSPPKKKDPSKASSSSKKKKKESPRSVTTGVIEDEDDEDKQLSSHLQRLTVGGVAPDDEEAVADATIKLVPDRIYSVAAHPSTDHIILSAGDKGGYVGLWNATTRQTNISENEDSPEIKTNGTNENDKNDSNDQQQDSEHVTPKNPDHHLVRIHKRPVSSMEWMPDGQSLLTTSYDGTCRLWNVANQSFVQVLGAYDDEETQYKDQPGFGLDLGGHFWFQSSTVLDQNSFLLSTSVGTVVHMDLRQKQITWNVALSEKKINTVSVHPNGHSMISSGLDTCVSLWDLRKFQKENNKSMKTMNPLALYQGVKSINSAYFSPVTGQHVVATTMNNRLDILKDFHLQGNASGKKKHIVTASNSMRHDNMTGRWLSTFMAQWHPSIEDLFCVGSMEKPRNVHVYDTKQQRAAVGGLSAVVSRVCFHPSPHEVILAGGNSSGRVTIVREYRGDTDD